ncbi:MAG: class I SAM-dependent methyltransferase, partial [Spirochaetes bacterium]|nr:class I SAM-dependent methyltransferase [Spirochaetota bacterium]
PGGRTVILELTVPESGLIAAGYSLYTGTLIPLTASLIFKRKAYKYLRESIRDFPAPDIFEKQITSAGFKNVRSIPLTFGTVTIFTGEKPL